MHSLCMKCLLTLEEEVTRHVILIMFTVHFFCNVSSCNVLYFLGKIEPLWARQLNESLNNRYSFVINAVVAVCREIDNDRLNDLSVMCAEMTACCNALSAEWLGVLVALCCPISHPNFYMDVLAQVDIQDLTTHNSLAIFTSILIGKYADCFI